MKMKLIAAAVAAIAANSAFALDLSASTAAITAGRVVYATGASAPTKIVFNAFRNSCQAGTIHAYTSADISAATIATSTPGDSSWKNFGAYSCTLRTDLVQADGVTPVTWAGQSVVFMHTVDGGSIKSVYGLSTDSVQQVALLKNTLAGCAASGKATANSDPVYHKCETAKRQAEGGFSDVEKQMWGALYASDPVAGINLADVNVTPAGAGQGFGVAVSKALYQALQVKQGITSAACTADTIAAITDPACMPTITKRDYASIANADGFSPTKTDWSFLLGSTGAGKKVNLCRRVDTSGTQASSNIFFLANPCSGYEDQIGKRYPATAADSSATFNVVENSGTGDVKKCLSGKTTGIPVTDFAIGVVSAENNPTVPATADDSWRFVKVDGMNIYDGAGNRANAMNGKYDFAYELVLHTHATLTKPESSELFGAMIVAMSDASMPAIDGLYRLVDAKGTRGGNSCAPFAY